MSPFFVVSKVYSLNYLGLEEIFYIYEQTDFVRQKMLHLVIFKVQSFPLGMMSK